MSYCAAFVAVSIGFTVLVLAQGNETVEYKTRSIRDFAGVVVDPSGAAIAGAVVTDCDAKYQQVFASIKTDSNGRFAFPEAKKGSQHFLKVDSPGFDEVRIPIKIQPFAKSGLRIKLHVGT